MILLCTSSMDFFSFLTFVNIICFHYSVLSILLLEPFLCRINNVNNSLKLANLKVWFLGQTMDRLIIN